MNSIALLDNQGAEVAQQYLTFMLGGEIYAVNIFRVKEIVQCCQLTEVPRMPAFIRGVINLRGSVVPVIDLSARFGKKTAEVTRRNCIVIVELGDEDGRQYIGMMVDAVSAVLEIPDNDIEPAPTFGTHIHIDFIAGMANINGKFVIVLNILHVLSMDDMESLILLGNEAQPLTNELALLGPKIG